MNGNELLAALPAAALSELWLRRLDAFAIRLIEHAARNTPPALSQRLQEEWLADLAARVGRLSRLRLAFGCWWAANVIVREYAATGLAAASANKALAYAPPYTPGLLSRRTAAVVLIACLHLALIYCLSIGLAERSVKAPPPPLVSVFREEQVNRTLPPPPPLPPKLTHTVFETCPSRDRTNPTPQGRHRRSIGCPVARGRDFPTRPTIIPMRPDVSGKKERLRCGYASMPADG
jgi:hypothetical protein